MQTGNRKRLDEITNKNQETTKRTTIVLEKEEREYIDSLIRERKEPGIKPLINKKAINIKNFSAWREIEKQVRILDKVNARLVTFRDEEYPALLRHSENSPPLLYIRGTVREEDRFALAIVGSRRPSQYGKVVAERLARDLSGAGFLIVSGMARGIDTIAHTETLRSGGRTAAVLGSGIDKCYPAENSSLMEKIAATGLVVSEFSAGCEPRPENFPRRNRLISGLSLGVLVIEATADSGSLITAKLIARLWKRQDGDGADYREHGPKVLEKMNTLLSNEPNDLFHGNIDEMDEPLLTETKQEIDHIFGHFNPNTKAMFRLGALYHGIGKYIIKERHPTIGWYTMEYMNPDEKDDLRALLGGREDYLQLLMIMIRDHDEFGVISTGEASYPILLRAANSLGYNSDDQKQILSAIMWLNLADMAGTPGLVLRPGDLKKVIKDWKWMLDAVEACHTRGKRLEDYVIEEASREEWVEDRITRLLLEACRGIQRRERPVKGVLGRVETFPETLLSESDSSIGSIAIVTLCVIRSGFIFYGVLPNTFSVTLT